MRRLIVPVVVAAALVAAAPAFAQRASLADRVAALERQESTSRSSNVDLLNQVNELRREVVALRSQVEELQHGLDQLRETSRAQYLDADGRLNRLEGGMVPGPADGAGGDPLPVPVPDAAEQTLAGVVERFPGSDAAVTADDRLRVIRLGRLR